MRRLLLAMIFLTVFGGVAAADRHRDHRGDRGRSTYRDNRGYRNGDFRNRRVITRNHVYHNNGRYVFHGGRTFNYTRPVIRSRYYDVRVRPRILVENYTTVPGYIWTPGNWRWDGYEWQWVSGHYAVDPSYTFYDGGGYTYRGTYYNGY
jgi:hypothetical protein